MYRRLNISTAVKHTKLNGIIKRNNLYTFPSIFRVESGCVNEKELMVKAHDCWLMLIRMYQQKLKLNKYQCDAKDKKEEKQYISDVVKKLIAGKVSHRYDVVEEKIELANEKKNQENH